MHPQLKKIYKRLPNIQCKGLCHNQCTVIKVSNIEREEICKKLNFDPFMTAKETGIDYFENVSRISPDKLKCPMLDVNNKCSIYENRPFICRVYGLSKRLKCEHGCIPDRWFDDKETVKMLDDLDRIK